MAESESTPAHWHVRQTNGDRRVSCAALVVLLLMVVLGRDQSGPRRLLAAPSPPDTDSRPASVALPPSRKTPAPADSIASPAVPAWAADAVYYQIFPERFSNGDRRNDPTRESLERPDSVPESWSISPWTGDWYARARWEKQIGPDFFSDGVFHRRYGGDLQGVIDKLDYLDRLGVNTIYFNPVFYARSLHKYDGNSFHHIDPYFGPDPAGDVKIISEETSDLAAWRWTAADTLFLDVIRRAHERGIRVIIDGVFNHTGRDFFAFADLRRRGVNSEYRDWYTVHQFDDPATRRNEFRYKSWHGFDSLPEFADNAAGDDLQAGPKQYVLACTRRWMDPDGDGNPADGVDGWRLDVAIEMPVRFWRDWNAAVRRINPDCYTVAEVWDESHQFLEQAGFSATMNYHGFAFPVKGFLIDGTLSASAAAREFDARRAGHRTAVQFALQNLIDSHDTDRLASMIVNGERQDYRRPDRFDYDLGASPRQAAEYDVGKPNSHERRVQRLVTLLQMTYVGAPMIYYGSEAGMWGADDPCDRMPMVWPELTYDVQREHPLGRQREADAVTFDAALFDFYRRAIALRRQHASLRRGRIQFISAEDEDEFLAFRRMDDKETLLVGINRGDRPHRWVLPLAGGETAEAIFTATEEVARFSIEQDRQGTFVTVPACDGVVLHVTTAN